MQRAILIRESEVQTPRRIQTGKGGKRTDKMTRRMSEKHSQAMMEVGFGVFEFFEVEGGKEGNRLYL